MKRTNSLKYLSKQTINIALGLFLSLFSTLSYAAGATDLASVANQFKTSLGLNKDYQAPLQCGTDKFIQVAKAPIVSGCSLEKKMFSFKSAFAKRAGPGEECVFAGDFVRLKREATAEMTCGGFPEGLEAPDGCPMPSPDPNEKNLKTYLCGATCEVEKAKAQRKALTCALERMGKIREAINTAAQPLAQCATAEQQAIAKIDGDLNMLCSRKPGSEEGCSGGAMKDAENSFNQLSQVEAAISGGLAGIGPSQDGAKPMVGPTAEAMVKDFQNRAKQYEAAPLATKLAQIKQANKMAYIKQCISGGDPSGKTGAKNQFGTQTSGDRFKQSMSNMIMKQRFGTGKKWNQSMTNAKADIDQQLDALWTSMMNGLPDAPFTAPASGVATNTEPSTPSPRINAIDSFYTSNVASQAKFKDWNEVFGVKGNNQSVKNRLFSLEKAAFGTKATTSNLLATKSYGLMKNILVSCDKVAAAQVVADDANSQSEINRIKRDIETEKTELVGRAEVQLRSASKQFQQAMSALSNTGTSATFNLSELMKGAQNDPKKAADAMAAANIAMKSLLDGEPPRIPSDPGIQAAFTKLYNRDAARGEIPGTMGMQTTFINQFKIAPNSWMAPFFAVQCTGVTKCLETLKVKMKDFGTFYEGLNTQRTKMATDYNAQIEKVSGPLVANLNTAVSDLLRDFPEMFERKEPKDDKCSKPNESTGLMPSSNCVQAYLHGLLGGELGEKEGGKKEIEARISEEEKKSKLALATFLNYQGTVKAKTASCKQVEQNESNTTCMNAYWRAIEAAKPIGKNPSETLQREYRQALATGVFDGVDLRDAVAKSNPECEAWSNAQGAKSDSFGSKYNKNKQGSGGGSETEEVD